jgi:cellulase/cellobiase CelA1
MNENLSLNISVGSKWEHENGIPYEVIMIANTYSKNTSYPITIIYKGENGKIWAKDLNNFLTRMTELK